MKKIVVVDAAEIQQGIVRVVATKPSLSGLFVGAVHLIADPNDPRAQCRIRANVILFDTEKAAREYASAPTPQHDLPQAYPVPPAKPTEEKT